MHSLARRQLRKCFGPDFQLPADWRAFVEAVDLAYNEFDSDRSLLERSLELSSHELVEANAKLRAMLQAFPDLFLLLKEDGTVLRTLSAESSESYIPTVRLVGRRIQDIPYEEVGRKLGEALASAVQAGAPASVEYSLAMPQGEEQYEARLIPLVKSQVLAVIRNISDRRRAEAERMKVSKLDSLGILAGGIAHDFNNLLAGMLSNLSLVRAAHELSEDANEILEDAELACTRATELTRQLLAFSKGGAPIRAPSSIAILVRDVAVFALRGSNVRCDFQLADDLLPVEIDVGQISQVLNNLVINSDQAMPGGGAIVIRAANVPATDSRTFPNTHRPYVEIEVIDQGSGITPQHIGRVFDPYFSTKETGSGLGLATSYAIVRHHDGLISIDSTPGVGTRVSVCLPATNRVSCTPPIGDKPLIFGHGRALIMDDDPQVLRSAGRLLRHLGFEPDFSRHGREAVEMCQRRAMSGQSYRFAILDLTIPGGVGGEKAARDIKEICPTLKLIASSGYFSNAVINCHCDYGFEGILPKPYSLRELNEALLRLEL